MSSYNLDPLIGMLLADPLRLNFEVIILGNLGIALMSLSAGSINQLLDQKIDSKKINFLKISLEFDKEVELVDFIKTRLNEKN